MHPVPLMPELIMARKPSILIVDDEPHIRSLIVAALKREGFGYCEAPNGKAALEIMRSGQIDAVILDLMMPIINGWDVLNERAKDPALKKIPVIVISANQEPALAEALTKGITAFLPKPFDLAALQAVIKSLVRSDGSPMTAAPVRAPYLKP